MTTLRNFTSFVTRGAAASALLFGVGTASASVVAVYDFEEFTSTTYAAAPPPYLNKASSPLGTATDLGSVGVSALQAQEVRDTSGGALDSFALLIGPGSLASNSPPAPAPTSTNHYLSFAVTAAGPLVFTDFSFDFGVSNSTTNFPHNAHAQLFYSIDGGETFIAVGAQQDRHAPFESFTGMINSSIDLAGVPPLVTGQEIEFRLGLSNDRGVATGSAGVYLDNLTLEAIPEPGAVAVLGIAGLGLLARRRRSA